MKPLEAPHENDGITGGDVDSMRTAQPTQDLRSPRLARDDMNRSDEPILQQKRAVLYLRVSTQSQVNTDYNPEGISLPAQREAAQHKALALGAEIVREFVEPGRTATSIDKRPVFQEMLAWIRDEKNIDYIVVYHFNRIFRDSIDAGISKRELAKTGTRVVSTVLDMGESPESVMVETIIHAFDQYQSQASGADISYKMLAKAKNGGTLGRAPLGYLNQRDTSEGRNVGIVIPDVERAGLVQTAFELYATGDYSLESLAQEMTDRGLRTRPGRRYGPGPISNSKLAELLRDRYYIGYLRYKGNEYPGRHESLVSEELFEQVQDILDVRGGIGVRRRRHHHYLKGSVWCGSCHDEGRESRMIMHLAKGNGGSYFYFFCRGRQQHVCDARFVEIGAAEEAVAAHYGTVRFPVDMADTVRLAVEEVRADEERSADILHKQLKAEQERLDTQEENLLELVADGALATVKARGRLADIQRRRDRVRLQLESTERNLAAGVALLEDALKLLENPEALYRRMAPKQRQLLNLAIFDKIYIIEDRVSDATYQPPFDDLEALRKAWESEDGPEGPTRDSHRAPMGLLNQTQLADGLSKTLLVGAIGLEPMTCWL